MNLYTHRDSHLVSRLFLLASLCLVTGCKTSLLGCASDEDCRPDAGIDAVVSCTGDDCGRDAGMDGRTGCTGNSCGQDAGFDQGQGTVSCTDHAQCPSNVCLPGGSCADDTQVAYVDPKGSDNPQCSKANPCTKVKTALETHRPYVKFQGRTSVVSEAVSIDSQNVTLLADPGAKLTIPATVGGGAVLLVKGTSQVAIDDLEITRGSAFAVGINLIGNAANLELRNVKVTNNSFAGIYSSGTLTVVKSTVSGNGGGGISFSGGTVTVSQSTLSKNAVGIDILGGPGTVTVSQSTLSENSDGIFMLNGPSPVTVSVSQSTLIGNRYYGIVANIGTVTVSQSIVSGNGYGGLGLRSEAKFVVVGNFFYQNGTKFAGDGGVYLATSPSATNRLEFNSFNGNQAADGNGLAVICNVDMFTARNNIMSGNGTSTNKAQISGSCAHTYSIIQQPGPLTPGDGNKNVDPMFMDSATGDLHLQPGSPAIGAADPNSDFTGIAAHDLDGDSRTNPADIGADELP